MANLPLAFGEILAGGVILTAGITGNAIKDVMAGDITPQSLVGAYTGDSAGGSGNAAAAGGSVGKVPASTATPSQSSVIATAGKILEGHGLNAIAASGIIGNALQESSWNPSSVGDGGGGLWGFTAGNKSLASLQAFAAAHGLAWTDVKAQTLFLLTTLSPTDIATLNAEPNPAAAAAWFMTNWEAPAPATENAAGRESGAETAYAQLIGSGA